MNWFILLIAGLFEVAFTSCMGKMKSSSGTELVLWAIGFVISVTLSMGLLYKAVQSLPIGTAYAIWTGIGAVGSVVMGILFFKEPISFMRLFFISTLIMSIVGLKLASH